MGIDVTPQTRLFLEGYIASRKSDGILKWRGVAQQALFEYLDVDPHVRHIRAQVMSPDINGMARQKFPALVYTFSGTYFADLRPAGALPKALSETCRAMQRAGLQLRLFDRDFLLDASVRATVTRLRRSRRQVPSRQLLERLDAYPGEWPATLAQLVSYLGTEGHVDQLIISCQLQADLSAGLGPDCLLSRNPKMGG
ncbi:hypothetical protein [Kordiimonas sp.]|uniref:hypothetical protein n=1 Tax=Kordiimonas sp. TaxID=1970157 RepID=UPI003B526956